VTHVSQIERLQAAGVDVAGMPEQQRSVLAALSAEEVEVILTLKRRLHDAARSDDDGDGDVEAHQFGDSGGAYW
jgi:hypothetical protein